MKNQVGRVKKLLSRYGFGSGSQLDLCTYQAQGHDLRQLHLGGGEFHNPKQTNPTVHGQTPAAVLIG